MTDLRTLAQAVVDAIGSMNVYRVVNAHLAFTGHVGLDAGVGEDHAGRGWVTLDAERAQGYARAMREVVEHVDALTQERDSLPLYRSGWCDGVVGVADWARERLGQPHFEEVI